MTRVCLGDVANERKENCKTNEYNDHIVGLEHLIPQEVTLTQWAENIENTFTKVFHKGDVLFGRRRAYLKKAAVAPFDGICSGDITVIEAKPNKIVPELLPFIIQNDNLFDYAVEKSAGSLSPRVKWSHLQNYEFELPDLNKQRELVELLWAAEETKQTYKKLIDKSKGLIQAKFINIFKNTPKCKLCEITSIKMGQSPDSSTYNKDKKGLPFYQGKAEFGYKYIEAPTLWCSTPTRTAEADDILLSVRAPVGDVNLSTEKCCIGRGLAAIHPIKNISEALFLYYALSAIKSEIENAGVGSTFKAITKDQVHSILIPKANIDLQKEFIKFAIQQEQTLESLQKSKINIDLITKSIINQNLTKEVSHV